MELYLGNSCKAAQAAATKAAVNSLNTEKETCGTSSRKNPIPEVGTSHLLDLPLGVKLPVLPGSTNIFYTTNISEKLYQPSFGFNLDDPYCRLLETSYKSLHDPHLKTYYKRKDILRRLRKGGYITSNNKVICSLKELNKYRNYLTSLKIDFEKNYIREQKMIEEHVHKLHQGKKIYDSCDAALFQEWLLQEGTQTTPYQELLVKQRYLDMVSKELDKIEDLTEKHNALRMREEERRHQDHIRRKLNLRRQIEEEWKTKEMLLLTKIGEEVKREAKVEQRRRKAREEIDRKKQVLLEKKIAYHLQKMQRGDHKREGSEESTFENKEPDETASSSKTKKITYMTSNQKAYQGHQEQKRSVHRFLSNKRFPVKKSTTLFSHWNVQNTTEPKNNTGMTKTSSLLNDRGIKSTLSHAPFVPTKRTNVRRQSVLDTSKQEGTHADSSRRKVKKPSFSHESALERVPSPDSSNRQQTCYQNRCQEKVTSEELSSIIHNIMTWVVAAVASILYPAITNYEERAQYNTLPVSSDSTLSSTSSICCSTCSETLISKQTKTVQAEPCAKAADRSMEQPTTPSKSSSVETKPQTNVAGKSQRKGKSVPSEGKHIEIFAPSKADTKKSNDAATETDDLEHPLSSDRKEETLSEMQGLKNSFGNFKCHLKEETELILENIFQEMRSDFTQDIPMLTSATAEVLVCQADADRDFPSDVAISLGASEIVEEVLEKLQCVVEKKCIEVFSEEDVSVHFKSDLIASEEPLEASLPYALENMNDIAEDMVQVILENLKTLASSKQNELVHHEVTPKPVYHQHTKDPAGTFLQRTSKRKSSAEPKAASLISKGEIHNLVSNILSQSSLVGHIEEAISIILGYVQVGLNNEKLVATEETVFILQLLDDILTQIHQKPSKRDIQSRCSRPSSLSSPEEKHRLAGTRVANGPRSRPFFPPVNVPGMVLYSEDENEEINKIVESALMSSIKDEKTNLQEQVPDHWSARGNADLNKSNITLSTMSSCPGKVAFQDWRLNTVLQTSNNKDFLKDKPCVNKDIWIFSQSEKYKIQQASENVITSILAEVLEGIPFSHLVNKNGQETSVLNSGKSQDLLHQEWIGQIFSGSEIHTVAQEIADSVLKILHMASSHITNTTKHSTFSSVYQTSVDNAGVPNKEPLKIWLGSQKKMKFLSALGKDLIKHPWLESGESESRSEPIVQANSEITDTIFKKLKSFICPKLQKWFKPGSHAVSLKPASAKKLSFQPLLSTYTTKVVKVVLDTIQKELNYNQKDQNLQARDPPKNFKDTGFLVNTEKELDSVVTKLNNDIMISSLITCICEMLSGKTDKSNVPLPSKDLRSKISHKTSNINQQTFPSFHWPPGQKEVHECARWQILDRLGDTLYDMLHKLMGDHLHSVPSDRECDEHWRMTTALQPDIQLTCHSILEDIITKLCSTERNGSFISSEFKDSSKYIDTDSLAFASLNEEMKRCFDIISSLMSSINWQGSQEVTPQNRKTTASNTGSTKEKYPDKLKAMTSDILETIFAKLEAFINRNFKTLGSILNGNKKSNKMDWESESTNSQVNTHEEQLHSTLYVHTKKVSIAILKAIQTELNVSLPDLETCVHNPPKEKQMLKKIVNLILDGILPDMLNETEPEERDIENYRYRPIYGNFLPGGAGPESYLENPEDTDKKSTEEKRPLDEEMKSDSFEQQELERILKKIEVELKEPQKSPVLPIIRNILSKIFQNDLIDQLNILCPPQSHLCDIPHASNEPLAQTSVRAPDKIIDLLVSEEEVTIVADGIVRTIFQKLYSAAIVDRNAYQNRHSNTTIPASTSFPKHTSGGKISAYSTLLGRNLCPLQPRFNISQLTKANVVEDIIQSVLTNLEMFITSKLKSLFCLHNTSTVPMTLPLQQDVTIFSQTQLSTKDSSSDDQFSCYSVNHKKPGKTTSICQLPNSKLNIYATQLTRHILQGIKHKLDKEIKNPLLTNNSVSESITSQIVNTMLDIVSTKDKHVENISDKETDPRQPEDIVEKLFNKSDYRKKLQLQILDTVESILSDICNKTLENYFPHTASSVHCNVGGRYLKANSGTVPKCANKAIPMILVPKSRVAIISSDIVDIILQNLSSAVMLHISAQDSISARSSMTFCGAFPKTEYQGSSVVDTMHERRIESFPFPRKGEDILLKPAFSDDNQTPILKKQYTKQSVPADPCEENANFITKTILNKLNSFVTERIHLLLRLNSQTRRKSFASPEFTDCKQKDRVFLESNRMPSDVNTLKISTNKTILSQDVTSYTLDNYREYGPTIHISQGSLKEYADSIASTILMLIKSDIDLEIQKAYSRPNNTSFQQSIIASEIVSNILKNFHDKSSLKDRDIYSKQNSDLSTQLAVRNEILPGQRKMKDNTELSLLSRCPDQNQIMSEEENLRVILEEIFRNGEARQEKPPVLLGAVKDILKTVYQRVMEDVDHWPPFNEPTHFTSESKIKTIAARKKPLQSYINSVANDIIESVFGKMFSIVVTSLYKNNDSKEELKLPVSDGLPMTPPFFKGLKQAQKRSASSEHVTSQVYPFTNIRSAASLQTTLLEFSPLQVGQELVQNVLQKITNFIWLNLEDSPSPKSQPDDIPSLRQCSSNTNPKDSSKPGLRKHVKTKSKVTSLPKFGTKPQLRPSGVKAKGKTKVGPGERTPQDSQSKSASGLQHLLSTEDTKNPLLRTKLPTVELKMYANNIVCNILEVIMNEFQRVRQNRVIVNALPFDQLLTASEIVNTVLRGLNATKNNLAKPTKCSHSDKLKLPQRNLNPLSLAKPEAQFSLENVSSQLEKIFPKEGIFKQMFTTWQTESSDMENEKSKLLMVAETVLSEILIKAKELEHSVSLLNLSFFDAGAKRYHDFERGPPTAEDSQRQINIFSHKIVEMLFEKLELCFLNQVCITESKESQVSNRKSLVRTSDINSAPIYNPKLKDKICLGSSHQIAQEIIEGILNTLESFADLQFKHVSLYAFSEIVKMPMENLIAAQQKPSMKERLTKLQPLKKFPDESESSAMVSQGNIQDTLRQLYSFHSELLAYTANTVNDILSIIKNKLNQQQAEPSLISIFEDNTITSQIISTLMEQCTHFYESLIKNHPKEYLFQGAENTYTINWSEFTNRMGMPRSKSNGVSCRDDPSQIPGLVYCSEEDTRKDQASSKLPIYIRYSAGDTTKTAEPMKKFESELKPSYYRSEAQGLSHCSQILKGNAHLPKDSVLPKLSQKPSASAQPAVGHTLYFRKIEESEDQGVFCSSQTPTAVSPLRIGSAAENTVNTMLLSYSLPGSPTFVYENLETMKPLWASKEKALFMKSKEEKDDKSLLKTWEKRIDHKTEKEHKSLDASGDFTLLEKWKTKSPRLEESTVFQEVGVIAFRAQELGPNEIHLVARYVTISVVTHFKNIKTTGPIASPLLRKKYKSKWPQRSTNGDSSLNEFCEHLTQLVISYIISRISDCTQYSGARPKSLESQNAASNKVITIYSQVFESRSISLRQLALNISDIIIQILLNGDIIKADVRQQITSGKTKYIYCPREAITDLEDLFQDLLIGVIHVLSNEIGINDPPDGKGRNKSRSMLRSQNVPISNKTKTTERQTGPRDWESAPVPRVEQLVKKNKLNSLACKLGTLVDSLKTRESKIVVNKIFNIVLDLFLPDKCPNWDTDSGKLAMRIYPSPRKHPSQNLGLAPKSAFLLNVVCENLVGMLLEECTPSISLTNETLSDNIPAECQLFNTFQNVCSPFEEYDMSDLLQNLEELDQENMVSIISHSLVQSLMEKLSQQPMRSPALESKHVMDRARGRFPSLPKAKKPELKESRQVKSSVQVTSYDNEPLTETLNNLRDICPKRQAPSDKQFSRKSSCLPPLQRPGKEAKSAIGVYSATFLEEIIAGIFLSLYTSLWAKNVNITAAQLNEMNILGVNSVVNKLNNARVTVLRDIEERMYFPSNSKETVSKIIDLVYNDILWAYELQVACSDHLAPTITSMAEQITNGILVEILDYQLPLCLAENLIPNSYHPLKAETILQKLLNNLEEFKYQVQQLPSYITMLSHSFLEDVIGKLLSQLLPLSSKDSCLRKNYLMTSDFNEISARIINKVMLAISKHKIWFTNYDHQHLYTEKNLQNMVESVYENILQMADSLVSIQKSIVSRSPIMVDRLASLIIQQIVENHLQPFLCGEDLPRSRTPLDEITNIVKDVLSEVTELHRPCKTPSSVGMRFYPYAFVEEVVGRLLSKIFSPNYNTENELDKMTQILVNSINNHFNKAKIYILCDDPKHSLPAIDTDIVDELVDSVYKNVLKQHGLASEVDSKELKDSEFFAENIPNLIVEAISGYLFYPLFSGDLSASSCTTLTADNIIQNIFSGISKSTKPTQHFSPYSTLLPYAFLEDLIKVLLSRIFPSALCMFSYGETSEDRPEINFDEIFSKLVNDIRMKISQHEIRFSKDEEETDSVYSDDEAQHLVDSVFRNILQNSGSQEAIEHDITSNNHVLIDRIAGFIIKNICQHHLHPFVYGKPLPPSSCTYFNDARKQQIFARVYPSSFLEDVICGVLSKIFHRMLGIVQTKAIRDSEKELLETAEELIYLITKEFSKAQVLILENAKELLYLPTADRDITLKITDMVYSKVVQEYELELPPNNNFLSDTMTLAERVTKIILAEVLDFQIHPDFTAKLPFKSCSKLNPDVLTERIRNNISKSILQKQTCSTYTTLLSYTHLEKIVTQVLSQISPLDFSAEDSELSQLDFSKTVMRLIDQIMSIISKHAICITKHGNENQHVISEKDIQAMIDAIYTHISHSNLYHSLIKDKKGINNLPVTKIASYVIKEIFNHHLQSFLPRDKTLPSDTVDQTYKHEARDSKQRELLCIVNSAIFLEEVISELLCKILYVFSHNILAAENSHKAMANMTGIVTTLVKSIVSEFTASEILVADNLDEDLYLSEGYKEMVQKTVNLIYEKILDDYKSLVHVYRVIQSDIISFGRKIFDSLLGEIYDYQMEALISGELATSSYTTLQDENIIRNVLDAINNESHTLLSHVTVLPRSLLENMVYKLLVYIFPSSATETKLKEKEVSPGSEFVDAASKLTDEIISEISEHEIRLATAEEQAESLQLGAIENFVDSICNNMKKIKFQAEAQKDAYQKRGSYLEKIAGFIMKEIVEHHLQPFLCDEETSPSDLPKNDYVTELSEPAKEKTSSLPQASVYSASFLEDVIIDLVRKFCTFPSIAENPKDKEASEKELVSMAINFANVLIGEFRKSEVKVLANAEETFSCPPIDKETVDKVSDSVYKQAMEIYGPNNIQKNDGSNVVIEIIAALANNTISAFKIQPLFSGDWSSTFSFLDKNNIIQRVQHLPYNIFPKISRHLKESPVSPPDQPSTSGLKNKMGNLKAQRFNEKENFTKEKTSVKKGSIPKPICTTITSIMQSKVTTLESELDGGTANKGDKKQGSSTEDDEKASEVISPTTSVKSKDTHGLALRKEEIKKKDSLSRKEDEKGRNDEVYQHFSPATSDVKTNAPELDFKIDGEKSDEKRKNSLEKEDVPFELPSPKSKVKEKRKHSPAYKVTDDKQTLHSNSVQNVTEIICSNVTEISSFQEPIDDSKSQSPLDDKATYITQEEGKDLVQPGSTTSASQNVPASKEENEKCEDKEIASKPVTPPGPPVKIPGILPVNILEDVISEIVNKLIFSSPPDIDDACQNVTNDINPDDLYEIAMKLIDSLMKEFSDAQFKILNAHQGNQSIPSTDKGSSAQKVSLKQKETSVNKAPSEIKMIIIDKIPSMHRISPVTNKPSSDQEPSMAQTPTEKTLVNKVVHSSVCNILQEYRSQDCIYKDINSNSENLAKRLANAVIEELVQHQLNELLSNEVPASVCLPLESKEFIRKIQRVTQTACKECQTAWPYSIILPHEFLESVISSLLSKVFSNDTPKISKANLHTQLDFLQMKLVNTIMSEISKDNHMIVQYIESLHPNDDELIQLVAQTIYKNLLSQFECQENIQNCITSGCRVFSETIVDLVVREVAGNQLQTYFSGELTPHQCKEVDSVVENILKGVIQTTKVPQPPPPQPYKLPLNIIEEIAVNFLSKLLSMFPKVNMEPESSPNAEMQKIISKILNSFQEYMSKNQIKIVPQTEESCTISLADSETIEKVVMSVYNTVLKHSGSHIAMYKDLMGKSNVLSDIIGLLMVKEIYNSEFHPQVEEEPSSSELVLEAVKILEKVVTIIDNLRSKEKPSSKKDAMLDATLLEEILALFLARLVKLPSALDKDAKHLSKTELNKITSHLTKSVIAEISRNNISIIAANHDEHLSPESKEIISQIADSMYNYVLQQCGTHEELYCDMKSTNFFFPNKVASLIVSKILNYPLEIISSKDLCANLFGDLDIGRIVERAHEHAAKMEPRLEKRESGQDLTENKLPVKIIPHRGKQPINIDPDIVAEHLGVISIKTQPLKKLQMECLARTGHSIESLRTASVSGMSYCSDSSTAAKRRKERRISLDKSGRLNVQPLEAASRNSFQNLTKPDITKVELLKDVQNKKDLIIRLVAHDIDHKESETMVEENLTSDEDEVILQEVVKEDFPEGQVEEDIRPLTKKVVSPKTPSSKSSLKKILSFSKCCQLESSTSTNTTKTISSQWTEPNKTGLRRIVSESYVPTLDSSSNTTCSLREKKTPPSMEEMRSATEPVEFLMHRIMSSSSYNEEDLPSYTSSDDNRPPDPSAKITEENLADLDPERSRSVKFVTLFQRESVLGKAQTSNNDVSDPKPSTSKQSSEVMKKVSSALSKVFSRSNANISKPSLPGPPPSPQSPPSPPDQDRS